MALLVDYDFHEFTMVIGRGKFRTLVAKSLTLLIEGC